MASDLIVPGVIMLALFVINAGVMYFILRERKRHDFRAEETELQRVSPS